jgi:hypothetical protein
MTQRCPLLCIRVNAVASEFGAPFSYPRQRRRGGATPGTLDVQMCMPAWGVTAPRRPHRVSWVRLQPVRHAGNDTVDNSDPSGLQWQLLAGCAVGGLVNDIGGALDGRKHSFGDFFGGALLGCVGGALMMIGGAEALAALEGGDLAAAGSSQATRSSRPTPPPARPHPSRSLPSSGAISTSAWCGASPAVTPPFTTSPSAPTTPTTSPPRKAPLSGWPRQSRTCEGHLFMPRKSTTCWITVTRLTARVSH